MRRVLVFLPFLLILSASAWVRPVWGEGTLEELLARIPAHPSGDENRYSLTDVQFALRARLDWNALLERARVTEEQSGLTFTLVVGSSLGSCGDRLVEWPLAPTMRRGEIFVSEGLLRVVFQNFPDYRMEGQVEEELDVPPVPPLEEIPLDEPPDLYGSQSERKLETVIGAVLPVRGSIPDGSTEQESLSAAIEKTLDESVSSEGIRLKTLLVESEELEDVPEQGDALVAFRVSSASPPYPTVFFYYDSAVLPQTDREHNLVEWDRVNPRLRGSSRSLAETFHHFFEEVYGEGRTAGVRGAPIRLLRGLRIPAIEIHWGISEASREVEIAKMAEVVNRALEQLKNEGAP